MAKENIRVLQLEQSLFGVGIFPVPNEHIVPESVYAQILTPHRHDHYCCFLLEEGEMNFNVDFQNIDIPRSSLLISSPGQVHQLGSGADFTGWMIAFDAKLIDENARAVIEQSFSKVALLHLDDVEKSWFTDIFKLIFSTVNEKKTAEYHHQIVQTLINAFFFKAAAIFRSQEDQRIQAYSSRSIEIAGKFHQLVKEHFLTLKKPTDYASKMNLTVSYLNDTVKSVTGFPSTYFIQQEIFREAQRLLFYTTKSVKEIGFQLGYDDYKYFIRLFSKATGTSPAHFRKNNQSA